MILFPFPLTFFGVGFGALPRENFSGTLAHRRAAANVIFEQASSADLPLMIPQLLRQRPAGQRVTYRPFTPPPRFRDRRWSFMTAYLVHTKSRGAEGKNVHKKVKEPFTLKPSLEIEPDRLTPL